MYWPEWVKVVAGIPAAAILAYLMMRTPKSVKEWLWGMTLFGYVLVYYFVFLK